ncbi:MAG: LysR family transcriptional regulator [Syntrophorhabdus sp.]
MNSLATNINAVDFTVYSGLEFYSMRLPHINPQHIITFYFVAKETSFSLASEKLCITQSAVTQQIKALELQFKIKLINVKRKRVYLTKAGEHLMGLAEQFLNQTMMIEDYLNSYTLNNLHLGIARSLTRYLTEIIEQFRELHPSVRVTVREGPSNVLAEELLDFQHDICIVGTLAQPNERLRVFRVPHVEKLIFVAGAACPLAVGQTAEWKDLARYPLILQSEGSLARTTVLNQFKSRGLEPVIGTETDNVEWAKDLVRQGKGIALMFLPNVKEELARGLLKIVPIADSEVSYDIDILLNREIPQSPVMEAFLAIVGEHFHYDLIQG